MITRGSIVLAAVSLLLAAARSPAEQRAAERSPQQWLDWFAQRWDEQAWLPPGRAYIRPLDDPGWRARMLALQGLAAAGPAAVEPLTAALRRGDAPQRAFAAQTLGYLAPHAPRSALQRALAEDSDAAVRLYAADALGMQGVAGELAEWLANVARREPNRDVRKHIGYALDRGRPLDPQVRSALVRWNNEAIASAAVGAPAPDFKLRTISGQTVQLSQYRGRPVVLIFIYGDT